MKTALVLMLMLNFSLAFGAQTLPVTRDEIDHLLVGVDKSGCQFYRNGSWYSSGEARSHLNMKYEYLARMGSIQSAEDFIEKAASKSSMSGEPYRVRCNDQAPMPSARWFAGELERYRAGATQPPAHPGR